MLSLQGGLGIPLAQRELQLDSQFVAEEKAVEAPNSFTDKTIKTEEFQQLTFFQELELHPVIWNI